MKQTLFLIAILSSFSLAGQIKTKSITEFSQKDMKIGILVDVRTPEEFMDGHLEGAINIDWYGEDFLERFDHPNKDQAIYLYCKKGGRSSKAAKLLFNNGYTNVTDLLGGFDAYLDRAPQ